MPRGAQYKVLMPPDAARVRAELSVNGRMRANACNPISEGPMDEAGGKRISVLIGDKERSVPPEVAQKMYAKAARAYLLFEK